ncbi:unnamed protein product [Clonostachys byssicola]|uniref:Uncharacterized protein n=1 Tax=Clonostachys byssicola TaxID=160290 RepID=A0A9N9Y2U4_9HYPO|nr:unnamed protein product [Clonostachys byssicola]
MPPIRTQGKKRGAAAALSSPLKAPERDAPKRAVTQRTIQSFYTPVERATAAAQRETISTVSAPAQATSGGVDEAHITPKAAATDGTRELQEICESSAASAGPVVKGAAATRKTWSLLMNGAQNEGEKEAYFRGNREWETHHRNWLGKKTKMVRFGSEFVLQDEHINELISLGPHICRNLTHFEFGYSDVNYGAKNSAEELTDEAVIRLVELCPKLRRMQLQGTSGLKDITLEAIFEYCPNISYVEITTASRGGFNGLNGSALDTLREHPDWGTKLKTLRLPKPDSCSGRDPLTRAVRALTKERNKLSVQLVSVSERKKWGDWELEIYHALFRKGRIQNGY